MNTPNDWLGRLMVKPESNRLLVEVGMRMAEDVNPVWRAVNLMIANQTMIELNHLLVSTCPSADREYQRGRAASLIDLHNSIYQMAETMKIKPPSGSG